MTACGFDKRKRKAKWIIYKALKEKARRNGDENVFVSQFFFFSLQLFKSYGAPNHNFLKFPTLNCLYLH